ncbi:hypothetical protein B0H19DRAFT_1267833 [Mycena capillaripes]|nr:hypothetical protein B0H19DRAFT_1267833 [Mycena capillaripes]
MPLLSRTPSELLQAAEYGKRDAPRIGGSEGGFIGLVVGLGVIILVSCVAIYILLRDHSPSQRDREGRRHDSRYPSETSRTASLKPRLPWSEKLGGLFGGGGGTAKRNSKSGHGWIQASGDAWEADEVERSREMSGLGQSLDAPFRPPVDPYAAPPSSSSTDSVAYDPAARYTPMPTSLRSDSPIPRSMSPESTVHPHANPDPNSQSRQFSVESAASVRTFEGGTKFIEGL